MSQIILELPYPPSVNAYWMASGHRRYISKRGMEFKKAVAQACIGLPSFGDQPVELSVVLHPRDKRLIDRKSTRLNSSHIPLSRMPSSA